MQAHLHLHPCTDRHRWTRADPRTQSVMLTSIIVNRPQKWTSVVRKKDQATVSEEYEPLITHFRNPSLLPFDKVRMWIHRAMPYSTVRSHENHTSCNSKCKVIRKRQQGKKRSRDPNARHQRMISSSMPNLAAAAGDLRARAYPHVPECMPTPNVCVCGATHV